MHGKIISVSWIFILIGTNSANALACRQGQSSLPNSENHSESTARLSHQALSGVEAEDEAP
jgi:hypothetical protein